MVCFVSNSGIFHVAPHFEKQSQALEDQEMSLVVCVCYDTVFYEVIICLFFCDSPATEGPLPS